ncbi:MAG: aldo/keto reductase [Pseudonocardiaceae bacterium]
MTRPEPPDRPAFSRTWGSCGLEVSAVGVGCWALGGPDMNLGLPMGWGSIEDTEAWAGLERAYTLGATLFDTADVYGHGRSERLLGRLVARVPRASLVLSSKVGYFRGTAAHGYHPVHLRHQLEQSLDNLRTDYLDIYFFHHAEFGHNDTWLDAAIETMGTLRAEGLVRVIGMRGPYRFALDRVDHPGERGDKVARFRALFEQIQPDVLAVRDNLLTPHDRSEGIFAFAADHNCGVLINKPLAQGLLTGSYDPRAPRVFGEGDHRRRKRWFTPPALAILTDGLDELRQLVGQSTEDVVRIALWSCLQRYEHAAVLVGFTTAEQIALNLTCLGQPPSSAGPPATAGATATASTTPSSPPRTPPRSGTAATCTRAARTA